ncbi:MAG: hypothetical protein PHU85_10445 [Phycisphaerae bacterium]|nr:hypothetical protein [Phycisphaerae bacterium]
MSKYTDIGMAAAKAGGLDAAAVRSLGYREVAGLCGATVEKNGDSPEDFFYECERRLVSQALEAEATAGEKAALETELAAVYGPDAARSMASAVDARAVRVAAAAIATPVVKESPK